MIWKLMSMWNLASEIYSSFIHSRQNMEANKMSFCEWVDKLVHLNNGILFRVKKRGAFKPWEEWRKLKCLLLSEINQSEKVTCCMTPTIWLWERWNQSANKNSSDSQGFRGSVGGQAKRTGKAENFSIVKVFSMI